MRIIMLVIGLFLVGCVNSNNLSYNRKVQTKKIYRNSQKEVVIDNNLMWQDDKSVTTTKLSWSDAKKYCKNLTFAGYSDWRLPSRMELLSIVDRSRYKPAIKKGFKYVNNSAYWSSTPYVSNGKFAWNVNFDYGNDYRDYKTDSYYVRCVRDSNFDTLNFETLIKTRLPQKEEFETSTHFKKRVAQALPKAIKYALEVKWGKPIIKNLKYDADNQLFVANVTFEHNSKFHKKMVIKVPLKDAKSFKYANHKPYAVFDYNNGSVKLTKIEIPFRNKIYLAEEKNYLKMFLNYFKSIVKNKKTNTQKNSIVS